MTYLRISTTTFIELAVLAVPETLDFLPPSLIVPATKILPGICLKSLGKLIKIFRDGWTVLLMKAASVAAATEAVEGAEGAEVIVTTALEAAVTILEEDMEAEAEVSAVCFKRPCFLIEF